MIFFPVDRLQRGFGLPSMASRLQWRLLAKGDQVFVFEVDEHQAQLIRRRGGAQAEQERGQQGGLARTGGAGDEHVSGGGHVDELDIFACKRVGVADGAAAWRQGELGRQRQRLQLGRGVSRASGLARQADRGQLAAMAAQRFGQLTEAHFDGVDAGAGAQLEAIDDQEGSLSRISRGSTSTPILCSRKMRLSSRISAAVSRALDGAGASPGWTRATVRQPAPGLLRSRRWRS